MKMPRRAEFGKHVSSFLAALDGWMRASEAAYQYLRGMYDATSPVKDKPQWVADFGIGKSDPRLSICNVEMEISVATEAGIEAALRNISGHSLEGGRQPVRICHGEMSKGFWSCYCELMALADV